MNQPTYRRRIALTTWALTLMVLAPVVASIAAQQGANASAILAALLAVPLFTLAAVGAMCAGHIIPAHIAPHPTRPLASATAA